jgi:Family of unknown function (DUF6492)
VHGIANPIRYTLVIVAFEEDAGLLALCMRSIRKYFVQELIEEIIVVDNSLPGSRPWHRDLLRQCEGIENSVRIVHANAVAELPKDAGGWYTQQVLKLKIAALVRTTRYVILDAKNQLISPLTREFLETEEGLVRSNGYSYAGQPMQEFLEHTLEYLGLNPAEHLNWFTRTTTPFTMVTEEVCSLIRYVEEKERAPFGSVFLDRKLSEFFLYSGYLISKGTLNQIYEFTQPNGPTIWIHKADVAGCDEILQKARKTKCPWMSVHRKAIARLAPQSQEELAAFWHERGLFPSLQDAVRFLQNPNGTWQDAAGRVFSRSVLSRVKDLASRFASRT